MNKKSVILNYLDHSPKTGERVFLAPGAFIIGQVTLGDDCSVFYNTVLRADINFIKVGARTNIQDNCTFHVSSDSGVTVGEDVTVGHNVVLHACEIGDCVTLGMGSIVMDGAVVGEKSIVAAGALITKGKKYPPRSIIAGSPAKVIREITEEEIEGLYKMAQKYIGVKNNHQLLFNS